VRVFGGDPTNPENRMRTGAMLQVGRVPETLRVREHVDLFSAYYLRLCPRRKSSPPPDWKNLGDRKFGDLSEAISKLGAGNRVEAARIARTKGWL
jgi:ABC-2 type transport system ATP-binding protein